MRQETFTLTEGKEILIQFPAEMSAVNYEDFSDWIELLHRKVGRAVEGGNKPKIKVTHAKETN